MKIVSGIFFIIVIVFSVKLNATTKYSYVNHFIQDTLPSTGFTLKGIVKDVTGSPLNNVSITIGISGQTITDTTGTFSYFMPEDNQP